MADTVRIKVKSTVTGKVESADVECERIGPFAIYPTPCYDGHGFTVGHVATGYAVQRSLPTIERARWLARKLLDFDVWKPRNPKRLKEGIDADTMNVIKVLRMDAMAGDCQGEFSDDR